MGNSEVGHLNLGAGRVVKQDLVRIDESIEDGSFFTKQAFLDACRRVREKGGTLHLMGLLGDGGVHAMDRHLHALIDLCAREGVPRVALHCLIDGRDTMPTSGLRYMRELLRHAGDRITIASLGGRYFGMDRDRRWERVKKWYDVAVLGRGPQARDPLGAIEAAYARGETDEFITPVVISTPEGAPRAPMRDGDAVIAFNFRSDRMRQIVRALTDPAFDGFDVHDRPAVTLATMTSYDERFSFPVAFPPFSMARIVAEVVSSHGRTMFRTAETEKYPHVTYFFNGGIEVPFPGGTHLVPSPKVPTYDLQPEMSAVGVTDVLCQAIASGSYDFRCVITPMPIWWDTRGRSRR
jgi:2,3-bisphosphoglycerate-independent phosphoglycerate mutase